MQVKVSLAFVHLNICPGWLVPSWVILVTNSTNKSTGWVTADQSQGWNHSEPITLPRVQPAAGQIHTLSTTTIFTWANDKHRHQPIRSLYGLPWPITGWESGNSRVLWRKLERVLGRRGPGPPWDGLYGYSHWRCDWHRQSGLRGLFQEVLDSFVHGI